jgi:AcrR family transcriptional regulator
MARTRAPGRLGEILDAAHGVFVRNGYRRTRMHDVATAAAVSPGLLYTYAAGKDALFSLVVQRAAGVNVDDFALPARNPEPEALLALVRRSLNQRMRSPVLEAALQLDRAPKDVAAEVEQIVGEHYDNVAAARDLIALVERSAADWPELADVFFTRGRRTYVDQLGDYFARRGRTGALHSVVDAKVAARLVVETVAWFANHRFGDYDGAAIDNTLARATTVDLLTNAFLP